MKKNVMLLSCAALLALALAGCAQSTAQADYIGTDAAKAIALEAAGIGEADATFTTAELDDPEQPPPTTRWTSPQAARNTTMTSMPSPAR